MNEIEYLEYFNKSLLQFVIISGIANIIFGLLLLWISKEWIKANNFILKQAEKEFLESLKR